jgi:plasmid stabilization system protein ParE
MGQVIWTPIAESDLDDILYYIAVKDQRPQTAIDIYFGIRDLIETRFANETIGHRHPIAPEGWLYFQFKRWLIFYQTHPDGIEVMRVVDGVRDLPKSF